MIDVIKFQDKADQIFSASSSLETIASGYHFTEGPVWDSVEKCLYFTNFQDNTIYKWSEEEGCVLFRRESGRAVGLSLFSDGRVVSAETKSHAVTIAGPEKSQILAGSYEGKILNIPNDVVVSSTGWLYFTDPYSVAMNDIRELDFNGVYAVSPEKEIFLLDDRMERPNGIAFSPDETILYVNDTNRQLIQAYQMRDKKEASLTGVFARLDVSYGPGAADGMKVDVEGNVYVTGPAGIWVVDKNGDPVAILKSPEFVGNFCFGGENNQTLFITASTSVYRVPVGIPGIIPVRRQTK